MGRLPIGVLAVGVAFTAGCGSDSVHSPPKSQLARGKQVFVDKCGSCHSLKAAGTKGVFGGPLDGLRLKQDFVEQRVRFGASGMPGFDDQLSDDDIAAVTAFVSHASGR